MQKTVGFEPTTQMVQYTALTTRQLGPVPERPISTNPVWQENRA